jgi:PTH1 family peptidyl-tRNA hydrolase
VKWIVGLGNPGREYELTRHNIGFLVVDEIARRLGVSFRKSFFLPAWIATGCIDGEKVRLVKPRTFMNRSGRAVGPMLRRKSVGDLLLVYDDTALSWGQLRLRARGSAGGHNGVQSILDALGESAFSRIRVGIGSKPDMVSLPDYVLGEFSADEKKNLDDVVGRAANAVEDVCKTGIERAMNHWN